MRQESEVMTALQYSAIAVLASCCILVGCGDSQKAKTDTRPDERDAVITRLQSAFAEARDRLTSQESQNKELADQIQALTKQLREKEAAAETSPARRQDVGDRPQPGAGPEQQDAKS